MKISLICLPVLLLVFFIEDLTAQIVFQNHDFEESLTCDPNDPMDLDVSCITGWWNYLGSTSANDVAWVYYDDYLTLELDACDGERGIKLSTGTGDPSRFSPATKNPFYGLSKNAVYGLDFLINVYSSASNIPADVEVLVSSTSTGSTGIVVATSDAVDPDGVCRNIHLDIIDEESVEDLVSMPYIYFKISWASQLPSSPIVSAVIDEVTGCTILDFTYSVGACDEICVTFTPGCDEVFHCEILPIAPATEPIECSLQAALYDESEELVDYCYLPYIAQDECCFSPVSSGLHELVMAANFELHGVAHNVIYSIPIDYQPCNTISITQNTCLGLTEFPIYKYVRIDYSRKRLYIDN